MLEAARALSREPSARRLVDTLIQICARESGAERGVLMLSRGGPLTVAAVYNHESRGEATDDAQLEIPRALIEHVGVADEALVVDNALADPELARSPYVQRRRPRALLCVPLRHRERSVGALYLENTLTAGVFTRARVELVELLATQAALALLVD
ncbi:MAG: GAF domain-containing protein [Myxococcales bacterium]|nr:GAF domain-containing protein [Myxococcales bacterium]